MQVINPMLKKIKSYLTKKPNRVAILAGMNNAHLIALARLMFIKPEALAREARNNKDNGKYLLEMAEYIQKEYGKREEK